MGTPLLEKRPCSHEHGTPSHVEGENGFKSEKKYTGFVLLNDSKHSFIVLKITKSIFLGDKVPQSDDQQIIEQNDVMY